MLVGWRTCWPVVIGGSFVEGFSDRLAGCDRFFFTNLSRHCDPLRCCDRMRPLHRRRTKLPQSWWRELEKLRLDACDPSSSCGFLCESAIQFLYDDVGGCWSDGAGMVS